MATTASATSGEVPTGDRTVAPAVHTPGPWEQDDNIVGAADGGMHICTVTSSDDFPCITDDDEQTEAEARAAVDLECACNARLIAAAPDMDSALADAWKALMWIKNYDSEDKVLAAAISKIEAARTKAGTADYEAMRRGVRSDFETLMKPIVDPRTGAPV